MVDCVICSIIQNKLKNFIVYEDKEYIVFLDHHPVFLGHCLLAPKAHIETIYELPVIQGNSLLSLVQKIGLAIQQGLKSEGTFIAVNNTVSQSIPHLHVHLIPRNKGDGLKGFFWPRQSYANETEMKEIQHTIKAHIID